MMNMHKHSFTERVHSFILRHIDQDQYDLYQKLLIDKYLRKFGPEILTIIFDVTKEMGIEFWLSWGSVLGYYREHDFIKGDNDIDIGMFRKDITPLFVEELVNRGFEFRRAVVDINLNGIHFTMNYKNVKVDFYSYCMDEDKTSYTGFAPMPIDGGWKESALQNRYSLRWVTFPYKGTIETDFVGIRTKVPQDAETYLKILYGENFMIPIPGYKNTTNKNIVLEYSSEKYAYGCDYNEFLELLKVETA